MCRYPPRVSFHRACLLVLVVAAILMASFPRAGPGRATRAQAPAAPVRAAFLYLGPIESNTWSYAHEQGQQAAASSLGIETAQFQAVTADDAENVIRRSIAEGYNAVFATSFDFAEAVLKVAPEYPNVVFEQATGVTTAPNVGTYDGRIYQGWYLAGMAAGSTSNANRIGYVAPLGIPEVVRNLNAFTLGARSVNAHAQVYPAWINTFFDPDKERTAAEQLVGMGVDVIARETDSTLPEQVAAERGIWAVAYNAIPSGEDTSHILTAPIWHWEVLYTRELADLAAGAWQNTPVWWGVPEGLVDIAPVNQAIPADTRAKIAAQHDALRSGAFEVFAGPLKDNTGQTRVSAGATLTDAQLLSIDWLVDGVVGTIPPSS